MIIEGYINRIGIEQVRTDIIDKGGRRYTGQTANFQSAPACTTIFGRLDDPVIGPDIKYIFIER